MRLIEKISMKTAVKCTSVTASVCAALILGTVVVVNLPVREDGQGGWESPRMSELKDAALLDDSASASSVFIETPAGKDGKAVASSSQTASSLVYPANSNEYNLSYFTYRVRKGDIPGTIAEKFGITTDSVLSLNHINNARGLQIDQYLKIPTMSGILYTTGGSSETVAKIAEKYEVDASKVAAANHLALNAALPSGTTVFVTDAEMDWETRQEINGDLFRKPIKAAYRISSTFGWRSSPFSGARSYHTGIDMACPTGTSVYAALAGKVTSTGYSPTYGNYVIVQHHSGYKTLYGHLSAILCMRNQVVDQGTRIGRVGSTGLSTGPHLHFTVYKNGALVNPALLWY
jgi:murein DD-endopeptidase MepM/ murein hydrolase activator NlpD